MRSRSLALVFAALVLAGCSGGSGGEEERDEEAPVVTEAPAEDAGSESIQISGDFAADLEEYTGIIPDDVDEFHEYVAEGLCESDVDPGAVGPGAFSVNVDRYGVDDPGAGTSPDLVRLVIAYDCPSRADLAEEYLAEVGA